jgi:hypothetical protein
VILGTIFSDVLTDLELSQLLNHQRADHERNQQLRQAGERRADRKIVKDTEGSEIRKQFLIEQPVEQTSSGKLVGSC